MVITFLALSIIGLVLLLSVCLPEKRIVALTAIAAVMYIVLYLFASAIFLTIEKFTVFRVTLSLFILIAISCISFANRIKTSLNTINWNIKSEIIALLIIVTLLVFVQLKSSSIVPGYDAGVYGSRAISLMAGDSKLYDTVSEYSMLSEENALATISLQKASIGLYIDNQALADGTLNFQFHASPIWPALMALSGTVLGIENISAVLGLLLALSCLFMFYIIEKATSSPYPKYVGLLIFGFSPLILYLAKISLSELLLTLLVIFVIYCMQNISLSYSFLGAIAAGIWGYVHISLFAYMPLIFVSFLILLLITKNRLYSYLYSGFAVLYSGSLFFLYRISAKYTIHQLSKIQGIPASMLLIILCVLMFISAGILLFIGTRINRPSGVLSVALPSFLEKRYSMLLQVGTIVLLAATIIQGYRLGYTDAFSVGKGGWAIREDYANRGIYSIFNLTIFSVMMATSIISLLYVMWSFIIRKIAHSWFQKLLYTASMYTLAIYTIMRPDISSNYYASRYLTFFLMVPLIILFTTLIKTKRLAIIAVTICICFNLPFNLLLKNTQEYSGNWHLLNNTMSIVEPGSVVMINSKNTITAQVLTNNLRVLNDNLVFEIKSLDEVKELFPNRNIYVVSNQALADQTLTRMLSTTLKMNGEIMRSDPALRVFYPVKMEQTYNLPFNIYKVTNYSDKIDMSQASDEVMKGFYSIEGSSTKFRWSSGEVSFTMKIDPAKVNSLKIIFNALPDGIKEIPVSLACNGQIIYEDTITELHSRPNTIYIPLDKTLLTDDINNFTMQISTWKPSEIIEGSKDTRDLGIPIISIEAISN